MVPFRPQELAAVAERVDATARELSQLETGVESYWLARYFADNIGSKWSALFLGWLRVESGLGRVLLVDLGLEVRILIPCRCTRDQKVQLIL